MHNAAALGVWAGAGAGASIAGLLWVHRTRSPRPRLRSSPDSDLSSASDELGELGPRLSLASVTDAPDR